MYKSIHLLLLALAFVGSVSPADTKQAVATPSSWLEYASEKTKHQITKAEKNHIFGAPTWQMIAKSAVWFGGTTGLMIYANHKLRKDRNARKAIFKAQQQALSAGPLANLAAVMQTSNDMFPIEVRGPMLQSLSTTHRAKLKQVELEHQKDILSSKKRHLWRAVSWICMFLALYNGVGLWRNVSAKITGKNPLGAAQDANAVFKKARSCVDRLDPGQLVGTIGDNTTYAAMKTDKEFKDLYKKVVSKDEAREDKTVEALPLHAKLLSKTGQYCDRINYHATKHLNDNWFAKLSRAIFGHDTGTRSLMWFRDFNKSMASKKANGSDS